VDSLCFAWEYLEGSILARQFVQDFMAPIISILVDQSPLKIGVVERACAVDSMHYATRILVKDLQIQVTRRGTCQLFVTLAHMWNPRKTFFRSDEAKNRVVGLPEVRRMQMERFAQLGGFTLLHHYLQAHSNCRSYPPLEVLSLVLQGLSDMFHEDRPDETGLAVGQEIMACLLGLGLTTSYPSDEANATSATPMSEGGTSDTTLALWLEKPDDPDTILKAAAVLEKIATERLKVLLQELQRYYDKWIVTRRADTYNFYRFWRKMIFRLISSPSLPLKLFGWDQMDELIQASTWHAPPPAAYQVRGTGSTMVNGLYHYAGEMTADGYARPDMAVSYVRVVPPQPPDMTSRKLTLFCCTMRTQQRWWFLSEADEEQPGTDRDVDYYQHKSKVYQEALPPAAGWITCPRVGRDPPPTLERCGVQVPAGQELATLEHQLAEWAITHKIVEHVVGDSTIHLEVVARSVILIKFLVLMCHRRPATEAAADDSMDIDGSVVTTVTTTPPGYCLQPSVLLFVWQACRRHADAVVSGQVHQLLVSILPLCPSDLAGPLIGAIQDTLRTSLPASPASLSEKRALLSEVAGFCSALSLAANVITIDTKQGVEAKVSPDVVKQLLDVTWSVLTHPETAASATNGYEVIQQYLFLELRNSHTEGYRRKHLQACIEVLQQKRGNAESMRMFKQALSWVLVRRS
jgi:hypothetical protein